MLRPRQSEGPLAQDRPAAPSMHEPLHHGTACCQGEGKESDQASCCGTLTGVLERVGGQDVKVLWLHALQYSRAAGRGGGACIQWRVLCMQACWRKELQVQ